MDWNNLLEKVKPTFSSSPLVLWKITGGHSTDYGFVLVFQRGILNNIGT